MYCTTRLEQVVGSVPQLRAPVSRMRAVARRLPRPQRCRAERRADSRLVARNADQRAVAARAARRRSVLLPAEQPSLQPAAERGLRGNWQCRTILSFNADL